MATPTVLFPTGKGGVKSRWIAGLLKFFQPDTALEVMTIDPVNRRVSGPGICRSERFRVTIAQVNAGATLLPAVPGYQYRLVDCTIIAVGGAAGAVTTVDILATLAAASRKLVAYAQANLTQSTPLFPGVTGATILADAASYTLNDANTAITIGKTGASVTTATHFDVILSYALEAA